MQIKIPSFCRLPAARRDLVAAPTSRRASGREVRAFSCLERASSCSKLLCSAKQTTPSRFIQIKPRLMNQDPRIFTKGASQDFSSSHTSPFCIIPFCISLTHRTCTWSGGNWDGVPATSVTCCRLLNRRSSQLRSLPITTVEVPTGYTQCLTLTKRPGILHRC